MQEVGPGIALTPPGAKRTLSFTSRLHTARRHYALPFQSSTRTLREAHLPCRPDRDRACGTAPVTFRF